MWLIRHSVNTFAVAAMCVHARGSQRLLTVIRDQALSRPKQQMNFIASRLDQFDCPRVCDTLGGLAVDLHYLISNLSGRFSPFLHVAHMERAFRILQNKSQSFSKFKGEQGERHVRVTMAAVTTHHSV